MPPAISDSEDEERVLKRKIITSNRLLHKRQRIVYKMKLQESLAICVTVTEDLKVTGRKKKYISST